jgi:hypothetical protein
LITDAISCSLKGRKLKMTVAKSCSREGKKEKITVAIICNNVARNLFVGGMKIKGYCKKLFEAFKK